MITAQQVADRIKADWPPVDRPVTCDGFKLGSPSTRVTGVAVTFMATWDVLSASAGRGLNFVITHEPTLYEHMEDTSAIDPDPVVTAKRRMVADNGLAVWRWHDGIHAASRDGIVEGFFQAMHWPAPDAGRHAGEPLVALAPTTVGELASQIKTALGARALRVVGNLSMPCRRVALKVGSYGSAQQIRLLARDDVDVLVVGETREWETVEYARDAAAMGRKKALIVVGHAASEEPGMALLARRVAKLVPEVPVEFIAAGDPFVRQPGAMRCHATP